MDPPLQHADNPETKGENLSESKEVGLSYRPNLTATLHTQVFENGEGNFRIATKGNNQTKFKPPLHIGERIADKISRRARNRIKFACRMVQFIHEEKKSTSAMITLTFGNDFPDDKTAKKLLDNFFKRFRRYKKTNYYLWVAERQKRGAIHFHILTDFTEKDFINIAWNEIVNKWQKKNNLSIQTVYPNVIQVFRPDSYLSKYITKGGQSIKGNLYGMSQDLAEKLNPISIENIDIDPELIDTILTEALKSAEAPIYINSNGGEIRMGWAEKGLGKLVQKIHQIVKTIKYE